MWLQSVLVISVLSSGLSVATEGPVSHFTFCEDIPSGSVRWRANIHLSEPIDLNRLYGGEITFISDDGKYIEVTGNEVPVLPVVCVTFQGNYTGHNHPKAQIQIKPFEKEAGVVQRQRRSTEIWRVSSMIQSSNVNTLLGPLQPYHHLSGQNSISASTKHSTNVALTIHYAQGSYSQSSNVKGANFYTTPSELPDGVDDLILMYDVYFENFGWGNMGKLPGLYGGVNGEGAYGCGGGSNPPTCFSLRLMWRQNGDGELYAYIPSNQEADFTSRPDVIAHSEYGQSIGRGKIKFQNGAWNTVLEQVHLNSIGKTDGNVKICNQVQGQEQQCYTATNLRMRNDPNHHIRGIFFSTFFGGSNPSDAAPNDCHAYFKEFRLKLPTGVVVG